MDAHAFAFIGGKKRFYCCLGGYLLADIPLYRGEFIHILLACQGDGLAGFSGAGGAAYAVDIIFCLNREIVIDHQGKAFDIKAPGGDIGGNQEADFSGFYIFNN
jgi:hypothetical protein